MVALCRTDVTSSAAIFLSVSSPICEDCGLVLHDGVVEGGLGLA